MIYDEDPFRRSRRNRQQVKTTGGVCLNVGKPVQMGLPTQENREIRSSGGGGNYSVRRRWRGCMISVNLEAIWGMSDKAALES